MSTKLTTERIQALITGYVRKAIQTGEEDRALRGPVHWEEWDAHTMALTDFLARDSAALVHRDHVRAMGDMANRILKEHSIDIDKESDEYKMLCRELLKASVDILKGELKREYGDYSTDNASPVMNATTDRNTPPGPLLQDMIDSWFQENMRAKRWGVRTIPSYTNQVKLLVRFFGNVPVDSISSKMMGGYKSLLMKLPGGFFKTKRYERIPLSEVQNMETAEGDTLSVSTINGYLGTVSALFEYAVKNEHMSSNPAKGLKLPKQTRPDEERDPFTVEDLQLIFSSERYTTDTHTHPYCFWLPVLGLYTGCRIEELCQLYVEDVKQTDGLWVLNINDDGNDKRLKNKPSKRLVPLHPVLTDLLNFPLYTKGVKSRGHVRVFPELKKYQHRYSHSASKWFGRFKDQIGITADQGQKKVFHSFRHNLTDHLKQQQVDPFLIDELTGHAIPGETMRRYGKKFSPQVLLKEAILKLDYGIDLNHLSKSKYVVRK